MDPKLKKILEQKAIIERLQKELKCANDQIKFLTIGGCFCKLKNDRSEQDQVQAAIPREQSV